GPPDGGLRDARRRADRERSAAPGDGRGRRHHAHAARQLLGRLDDARDRGRGRRVDDHRRKADERRDLPGGQPRARRQRPQLRGEDDRERRGERPQQPGHRARSHAARARLPDRSRRDADRGRDVHLRRHSPAAERAGRRGQRVDVQHAVRRPGGRRDPDPRNRRAVRDPQPRRAPADEAPREPRRDVLGHDRGQPAEPRVPLQPELSMNPVRDERGIIMVVALGIVAALAGLTLAVATSGQMSTLTAALSTHAANAFYAADGAAYYGLSDINNFVPFMAPRATNLEGGPADLKSTVTANYEAYRALPGNLLIRTVDGNVRPAQFGQNEGLGKMYI